MTEWQSPKDKGLDSVDEVLRDFGFYHRLIEVQRMYAEYKNHGTLGYAGGVLDQPDEYWHDLSTMEYLARWIELTSGVPRLEQTSWLDNVRQSGTLQGRMNYDND